MPDDSTPTQDGDQHLVMRGYRRHRKHSRLGLIAVFCPAVAILWAVFWYLMMQQVDSDPTAPPTSHRMERIISMAGCLIAGAIGIALSLIGLMNRRRRHHLATAGLIVNIAYLVAVGMLIWLGAF